MTIAPPDDPDDDEPRLTPEQAAMVRRALRDMPAIKRATDSYQQAVAENMKPALDAIRRWHEQQAAITSDFFKSYALVQPALDVIASDLLKNVEFASTMNSVVQDFLKQQRETWSRVSSTISSLPGHFFLSNLREVEGITKELVEQVVMVDGIALYELPRTEIAAELIHADGASARRAVLEGSWQEISADCREVVDGLRHEALSDFTRIATAMLDALDAGHTEAAQSLAAGLLDSLLRHHHKKDRRKYMPSRTSTEIPDGYDELNAKAFIAHAPILQAYQNFDTDKGDPVPATFNRHATAHTVSPGQFTLPNAMQGVMLACGLLCHIDEEGVAWTAA